MKLVALTLLLLAICCSRTLERSSPPQLTDVKVAAEGEPYGLRLEADALTFCDQRGARSLDLKTGQERRLDRICPKREEPNTACSGLALEISVRAPLSEPNDIVDIDGLSFPLKGRVHDCAADGRLVAVVTASAVVLIDAAKGTRTEVSGEGGDRVAIGFGWVGWSKDSLVQSAHGKGRQSNLKR
jgi:hypothetical protein